MTIVKVDERCVQRCSDRCYHLKVSQMLDTFSFDTPASVSFRANHSCMAEPRQGLPRPESPSPAAGRCRDTLVAMDRLVKIKNIHKNCGRPSHEWYAPTSESTVDSVVVTTPVSLLLRRDTNRRSTLRQETSHTPNRASIVKVVWEPSTHFRLHLLNERLARS